MDKDRIMEDLLKLQGNGEGAVSWTCNPSIVTFSLFFLVTAKESEEEETSKKRRKKERRMQKEVEREARE